MSVSLKDIENTLDKIIILLKNISERNNEASTKEIVEAAAAKIIAEMKNCSCNKEILEALGKTKEKGKEVFIPEKEQETIVKPSRLYQYSFPNNSVGNEELGTGKNPNSMTWPPGFKS